MRIGRGRAAVTGDDRRNQATAPMRYRGGKARRKAEVPREGASRPGSQKTCLQPTWFAFASESADRDRTLLDWPRIRSSRTPGSLLWSREVRPAHLPVALDPLADLSFPDLQVDGVSALRQGRAAPQAEALQAPQEAM